MTAGAASWTFTEEHSLAVTRSLRSFLAASDATCTLLVERAGQLLATVGDPPRFDPTTLATLAAADFSANDQLARLIGEPDVRSLVHRGERESVLLADVAGRLLLVVLFDTRTTEGLVRLRAREVVEELDRQCAAMLGRASDASPAPSAPFTLLADADDEIDRLFR